MRVVWLAVALVSALAAEPTPADKQMNLGIEAYRSAHYAAAAEHFGAALRLDPGYVDARLYLATSYMAQYVPGSEAAENVRLAQLALDEFQQVLLLDPEYEVALASIASIYYKERKFEDAREWYEKLTSLDPDDRDAWYTLGVIAWSEWQAAKPEPPEDLKRRYSATFDEGIQDLEKALTIDPDYADAMVYLNLLLRGRAAWAGSPVARDKDIAAADGWLRKADETRKRKTEHVPSRP